MATTRKPKFPNAKTYKDKQGNIREVGTGRLIRRAPKPGAKPAGGKPGAKFPNAKTFKDANGVVRRIGTGIAVNPLDREVDATILTQTTPIQNRIGQSEAQYEAEQAAIRGANTALGSELGAIQQRLADLGSQQLGAAASAAGGTADAQQGNLAYLQNLLGSSMANGGASGLGGAVLGMAAQAQGEGAGAAADIALGQRGMQSDVATMGGAASMRSQMTLQDRMLARDAALKDYKDQIAAIKANRSGLKMDLVDRRLDQAAARQQIRLAEQQAAHQMNMDKEQLRLSEEELALAEETGGSGGSGGSGGDDDDATTTERFAGLNLNENQIGAVREGMAAWHAQGKAKSLNSFLARVVQSSGLSRTMAARIAMNVLSPAELKRYGKNRQAFLKSMTGSGVNAAVARAWANKVFGTPAGSGGGSGGSGGPRPETSQEEQDRLTGGGAHNAYVGKEYKGARGVRYKVQHIKVSPNRRYWHWTVLVFRPAANTAEVQRLRLPAGDRPSWARA